MEGVRAGRADACVAWHPPVSRRQLAEQHPGRAPRRSCGPISGSVGAHAPRCSAARRANQGAARAAPAKDEDADIALQEKKRKQQEAVARAAQLAEQQRAQQLADQEAEAKRQQQLATQQAAQQAALAAQKAAQDKQKQADKQKQLAQQKLEQQKMQQLKRRKLMQRKPRNSRRKPKRRRRNRQTPRPRLRRMPRRKPRPRPTHRRRPSLIRNVAPGSQLCRVRLVAARAPAAKDWPRAAPAAARVERRLRRDTRRRSNGACVRTLCGRGGNGGT